MVHKCSTAARLTSPRRSRGILSNFETVSIAQTRAGHCSTCSAEATAAEPRRRPCPQSGGVSCRPQHVRVCSQIDSHPHRSTPGRVNQWLFEQAAQTLLFDEEMRRKLAENNRYAALNLAERMLEAHDRGYWKATPEALENLKTMILEMETWLE